MIGSWHVSGRIGLFYVRKDWQFGSAPRRFDRESCLLFWPDVNCLLGLRTASFMGCILSLCPRIIVEKVLQLAEVIAIV